MLYVEIGYFFVFIIPCLNTLYKYICVYVTIVVLESVPDCVFYERLTAIYVAILI